MWLLVGLISWIILCFYGLRWLAWRMPELRFWKEIHVWYYSLALVGIVLLFVSSTRDREVAFLLTIYGRRILEYMTLRGLNLCLPGLGCSIIILLMFIMTLPM